MKFFALALASAISLTACTHNSDPDLNLKVNANSGGSGSGAGDYGATDGKLGGPCKGDIQADYDKGKNSCAWVDASHIQTCADLMHDFTSNHPNVFCKLNSGAPISTFDRKHQLPVRHYPILDDYIYVQDCDNSYSVDYYELDASRCDTEMAKEMNLNQLKYCRQLASKFLANHHEDYCRLPTGTKGMRVTAEAIERVTLYKIDQAEKP